jgi:hypothetical protein
MKETPRLIPIWLWVSAIIIIVLLCGSCRGGRSLGKGSAGTVIIPQTPQQINERNRQPPPKTTPVAPPKAVRSTPTPPESKSAEANPVIVNPKPAGNPKPFSPSVSSTPELVESGGERVIITPSSKNEKKNEKEPIIQEEDDMKVNWVDLSMFYGVCVLGLLILWMSYDVIRAYFVSKKELDNQKKSDTLTKGRKKENDAAKKGQEKLIKKPAKGTRKSRAGVIKSGSKKDKK